MRRWVIVGGSAVALLIAGLGGYYAYVKYEGRNIRGSAKVEFVPTEVTPPPKRIKNLETVVWPTYGFDAARLREAPESALKPPFTRIWTWHSGTLLEFPPAIAYGRLYVTTFLGRSFALDVRTGKPMWHYNSGRCGWASPAVENGLVYQTFINHPPICDAPAPGRGGDIIAFDARTGKIRWRRSLAATESSPLVAGGLVYVGDWSGRVYALDARTGRTRWIFRAGGQIKGSVALARGRLYIGSYDGHVYCLEARSGRLVWRASGQPRFGAAGTFYSTPAVAYGRVYIGSTDGKVYSFGAASGKLRWSYGTGGYVYGSPAVWRQLVLVGSYDHTFYAFDAATGDVRWRFHANGPISGSATVLNGIVYFSTFAHRTYALDAANGRQLWTWPDGEYSPVVADTKRLYLVGQGRLYGMVRTRT
jgi:outer membrane protein assembly factor BamB